MAKTKIKSAESRAPSCAKTAEQRLQIGGLLQKLVYAGLEQKGESERWWARCEQDHRNEFSEDSSPGTGLTPMHIPFTQPRVDMLTAQVCTVIAKQEPYMLAEGVGSDVQEDKVENTVHKFWQSAGFETAIRRASHICVDTNRVFYRVAWEMNPKKPFAGINLDVIHPRNICLFPATLNGIEATRLIGHRFYKRQREVIQAQKAGIYFNDRLPTYGDTPQEYDTSNEIASSGAAPGVSGPTPEDQLVELWHCLVRYADPDNPDEEEQWYCATFGFKNSNLLSFEPYPYSRPWYFDGSYITGNEEAYWSAISVSRHLSGLQDATDKMSAAVYNGSMMTAFPAVWGQELPQKDARYGYGEYIPTDSPLQNWSPSITFKGDALMESMRSMEEVGDRTSRISANSQGAPQAQAKTATENSIIAAGVATGLEEYIGNFSMPLCEMAGFTCELLSAHFNEWKDFYAGALEVTKELLDSPMLWNPNGSSPGNTPTARLQGINTLLQILKSAPPPGSPPSVTGMDFYTLTTNAIANMGFTAGDNLQIDKKQLESQLQQFQQQQQPPAMVQEVQTALQMLQQQGQAIGQILNFLQQLGGAIGNPGVPPQGPLAPPGIPPPAGIPQVTPSGPPQAMQGS